MKQDIKRKRSSVVYSFNARWADAIRAGAIKVFFRKRRPSQTPDRVYFYIGTPIKQIIGYAEVLKIGEVNLTDALALKQDGAINEEELKGYIPPRGTVNAVWISRPIIFDEPLGLDYLQLKCGFHPPQSFSNLDVDMEAIIVGDKR